MIPESTVHHGAMFDTNELVINMGPQHPSTHGVLRVVLRLDGEKVVDCDVVIGYLHRGIEKLSENRNWTQIVLLTDRMDYVAAATSNVGYCETVEKLLQLEVPRRRRQKPLAPKRPRRPRPRSRLRLRSRLLRNHRPVALKRMCRKRRRRRDRPIRRRRPTKRRPPSSRHCRLRFPAELPRSASGSATGRSSCRSRTSSTSRVICARRPTPRSITAPT